MLSKVQDQFRSKLVDNQKADMNPKRTYSMVVQGLEDTFATIEGYIEELKADGESTFKETTTEHSGVEGRSQGVRQCIRDVQKKNLETAADAKAAQHAVMAATQVLAALRAEVARAMPRLAGRARLMPQMRLLSLVLLGLLGPAGAAGPCADAAGASISFCPDMWDAFSCCGDTCENCPSKSCSDGFCSWTEASATTATTTAAAPATAEAATTWMPIAITAGALFFTGVCICVLAFPRYRKIRKDRSAAASASGQSETAAVEVDETQDPEQVALDSVLGFVNKKDLDQFTAANMVHIISTPYITNVPAGRKAEMVKEEYDDPVAGIFTFNPNTGLRDVAEAVGMTEEEQGERWLQLWTGVAKKVQRTGGTCLVVVKNTGPGDHDFEIEGKAQKGEVNVAKLAKIPIQYIKYEGTAEAAPSRRQIWT